MTGPRTAPCRWQLGIGHARPEPGDAEQTLAWLRAWPQRLFDPKRRISRHGERSLRRFLTGGGRLDFTPDAEPMVSVILVLHNRAELSYLCLRSLEHAVGVPFELIVADNASTDRTGVLLGRLTGATVLRNAENLGFTIAVNRAAERATGPALLLLNNDALLFPGAVEAALATLHEADAVAAVGGRIVMLDGKLQEAGSVVWRDGGTSGYGRGDDPSAGSYRFRRDVDYASGAFLLIRTNRFRALGGFDEAFAPAYYEDTDFCMRCWAAGHRVVYEPRARLLHYEYGSSSRKRAERQTDRNRRLFVERHGARIAGRPSEPSAANLLRLRTAGPARPRVLVVDDRIPVIGEGAGTPRARVLLAALHAMGYAVTLYATNAHDQTADAAAGTLPPEIEILAMPDGRQLERFLAQRQGFYDVVVVSRPHNMRSYGAAGGGRHMAGARLIYDAEAVFAARDRARARLDGSPWDEASIERELELAQGADAITTVSDEESRMFRRHGHANVLVLGHAVAEDADAPGPAQREGLLFVGPTTADDTPNTDAMRWFLGEVWPVLAPTLPGAQRLVIAGGGGAPSLERFRCHSVERLGMVDDLAPLYRRARVFVAPTRFAAGIPLKILDAAAHGVPVVATPLLARQLGWTPGEEIMAADTPEDFAAACRSLFADERLWRRIRDGALRRVRAEWSRPAFEAQLREALAAAGHLSR